MLLAFSLLLGACNKSGAATEPVASISLKTNASGTLVLGNKWGSNITYSLNGARAVTIAGYSPASITVTENDTIVVSEGRAGAFRSWSSSHNAFVSGVNASITSMPPMDKFTTDIAGTTAGNDFFSEFNGGGKLAKGNNSISIKNVTAGEMPFDFWNGTSTVGEAVAAGSSMTYNGQ
jgi:hypothetical protein